MRPRTVATAGHGAELMAGRIIKDGEWQPKRGGYFTGISKHVGDVREVT